MLDGRKRRRIWDLAIRRDGEKRKRKTEGKSKNKREERKQEK